MPKAKKTPIAGIVLVVTILAGAGFPARAQDQQLPPQDVVVLVDCSQSAEPYLKPIAGILNRFVGGSRIGDTFTCYQFSKSPMLVADKKLGQTEDVAHLKSQLRQLRVGETLTNYATAIERAMEKMTERYTYRPKGERVLILITDGRRHPDDPKSERRALEQLQARYAKITSREDFSFYCFYIGAWPEEDLQVYLNEAGAYAINWPEDVKRIERIAIADIYVMDQAPFLGHIPDVPADSSFSLAFYPRRPPVDPALIELEIRFGSGQSTLDRYFTVRPRYVDVFHAEAWKEQFRVETRGFDKGTYSGSFGFKPTQPEALLLYPRVVNFSFVVSGSLRVDIPSSLVFGPTGLKGEYGEVKQISISPTRAGLPGSADAVSVSSSIDLPEGIELNLTKNMNDEGMVVQIAVSRSRDLSPRAIGRYEGTIIIEAKEGWRLSVNEIPIVIDVSREKAGSRSVFQYVLIAVGCVGGVVAVLLFFRGARRSMVEYFSLQERPTGKLVLVYDPTKGTASNINLDRLCEKMSTKEITVGVGPGTHVELSHVSLMDKIYSFTGYRDENGFHTILRAGQGKDEVIINGMSRTGEITLKHLDRIKLGAFEFRFEMPRPLRQVVLYYLNGEALRGWLRSWNIDAEGFHFLDRDDDGKEKYVRYYELKTIAFVRDFEGELCARYLALNAPRSGHRVRLFLSDQEEITGYVLDWENPGERFYFFPDSMGDNIFFFVIDRNTIRNLFLLKEDEKGALKAQQVLSSLLAKMKKDVGD